MEKVINNIIKKHKNIFGENLIVNKINIGFTNTLYDINNKYIVKICINENNEENFKKEIHFYKENKDNNLIPRLYVSCVDKKDIPYFYEIIEKIDGVSLYNVWHTLDDFKREEIIKKLCNGMKLFHKNKGASYDWSYNITKQFCVLYEQAQKLNLFSDTELDIIDNAYSKFSNYLNSEEFVLIHNDLHFDNIFISNDNIKLIDFERSMYAPMDFELDILYRMIRKPWKFASEESEEFTKEEDYKNIMSYIEKYYPEIMSVNNLYERLAIYDMVYFLKQFLEYPNIEELKIDVLNAAKLV